MSIEDEKKGGASISHVSDEQLNNGSTASDSADFDDGWTKEQDKKLLRKIDLRLIPFLSLLYLLSFLDRVNIGQAKLDGLTTSLKLTPHQYSVSLIVFFVSYVSIEAPSNVLLKRLRPSRWIPAIMVAWGAVMTGMAFVKNYGDLVATRFLLGLAESGLFPGICFYLTSWYRKSEQNFRISIFFTSATLSGAFGGLLAYGLSHIHFAGRPSWASIFFFEGLATLVVGIAAFWLVHDFPEDAKFLNPEEREHVKLRLASDQGASGEAPFDWLHIRNAVLDWKTWVYALIYIGVAEPLYSLSLFTPTIISELGAFSRPESQLLSTPPYALATICTLISALYSDRFASRGPFVIFWMMVAVVGYIILLANNPTAKPGVSYFAIFLCVSGIAPSIPSTISWAGSNQGPIYARAMSMGILFTVGNSGGIISSIVYYAQDSPRYYRGHGVGLGFTMMAVILSTFMTLYLRWENRRRDQLYGKVADLPTKGAMKLDHMDEKEREDLLRQWRLEGISDRDYLALGHHHPQFRYLP